MCVNIVLVALSAQQNNQTYFDHYEPLALPVLKGHLLHKFSEGIKVTNIDMQHNQYNTVDKVLSLLMHIKPDIIGLSVPWGTINILDEFIKIFFIKQLSNWDPIIVLGKQLPSNLPEEIIDRYSNYFLEHPLLIAIGPGENTLEDLVYYRLSGKLLREVRNIVYKQNSNYIYNKGSINFKICAPALHENVEQYNIIALQSSRGCSWSKCSFCLRLKNSDDLMQGWLPVDMSLIIREMIELSAMDVKGTNIIDENFVGGYRGLPRVKEFIKQMKYCKETGQINKNFLFSISIRADEVLLLEKNKLLQPFKEAGLCFLFIGIESCSNTQLRRYSKGIDTKIIMRAIYLLNKYDILFEAGFILLDPFVKPGELRENIKMLEWNFNNDLLLIDFVADPLNRGRIFHKSPLYEYIIQHHSNLLGEFNINRGQYDYSFYDDMVTEIVKAIEDWYPDDFHNSFVKPIRHILMHSIHNLQDLSAFRSLHKHLASFRRLELNFLKTIIAQYESNSEKSEIHNTISLLKDKRNSHIQSIYDRQYDWPQKYRYAINHILQNVIFD